MKSFKLCGTNSNIFTIVIINHHGESFWLYINENSCIEIPVFLYKHPHFWILYIKYPSILVLVLWFCNVFRMITLKRNKVDCWTWEDTYQIFKLIYGPHINYICDILSFLFFIFGSSLINNFNKIVQSLQTLHKLVYFKLKPFIHTVFLHNSRK